MNTSEIADQFQQLKEYIFQYTPHALAGVEGMKDDEINELEKHIGIILPLDYRAFLLQFGKNSGTLVSIYDCFPAISVLTEAYPDWRVYQKTLKPGGDMIPFAIGGEMHYGLWIADGQTTVTQICQYFYKGDPMKGEVPALMGTISGSLIDFLFQAAYELRLRAHAQGSVYVLQSDQSISATGLVDALETQLNYHRQPFSDEWNYCAQSNEVELRASQLSDNNGTSVKICATINPDVENKTITLLRTLGFKGADKVYKLQVS